MKKGTKFFLLTIIIVSILVIAWGGLKLFYYDKFLPSSRVAGVSVSGLTSEKALEKLEDKIKTYKQEEVAFKFKNQKIIYPLDFNKINYQTKKAVSEARQKNRLSKLLKPGQSLPFKVKPSYQEKLLSLLKEEVNQPLQEEKIYFKQGQLYYQEPKPQLRIDKKATWENIKKGLGSFDKVINIVYRQKYPQYSQIDLLSAYYQLADLINVTPIKLVSESRFIGQITSEDLISWINVEEGVNKECKIKKGCLLTSQAEPLKYQTKLNGAKIKEYVNDLGTKINSQPQNAQVYWQNGLKIKKPAQFGFQLKQDDLIDKLKAISNWQEPREKIVVKVKTDKPRVHKGNINKLGIKKLIGKGETTFYGSSDNRIHNIKTGAEIISGTLIGPGEVFSAVETLGDINKAKGFVPELVIIGDETKDEVGGGLCQISSTLFRAALRSGFGIVERHNHAYRVGYYEPPIGMDATVYVPWTDLKFKNNTDGWALIEYQMSGYQLAFNVYGSDDGRKISISQPKAKNFTNPPKPTIIKDKDLKPGEKIIEEHAHQGADAWFNYQVKRDGQTLINQKITSHYQSWPKVIRVGPKKKDKDKKNKKDKKKKDEDQ